MATFTELLGPDPDAKNGPGTFTDLLGPPPQTGPVDDLGRDILSGPEQDHDIANSGIGRILSAIGQGASEGWGTGNIGMNEEVAKALRDAGIFNDAAKGQQSIVKAFNEAALRPAAAALDLALRAGSAATSAAIHGGAQTASNLGGEQFGRGVGGVLEATLADAGSRIAPHPPRPALDLAAARAERVIGEPEPAWKGTAEPVANENVAGAPRLDTVPEAMPADPELPAAAGEPAAGPTPLDAHGLARQIAPETFQEFDALTAHQADLRQQIGDQATSLRVAAEAQAPGAAEIATLESRLENTTPRLAKKYQARLDGLRPARDAFLEDEFTMGALARDTPELAALRQQLLETQYRMRDLAPEVTDAYRQAGEQMPAPEMARVPEPTPLVPEEDAAPISAPDAAAPAPAPVVPQASIEATPAAQGELAPLSNFGEPARPASPAAPEPSTIVSIAQDVAQKLQAAGRPAEEAGAAAQVTEALWRTRAAAFEGRKGTAEALYAREAPDIRAGRGVTPASDLVGTGGKEFEQAFRPRFAVDWTRALDDLGRGELTDRNAILSFGPAPEALKSAGLPDRNILYRRGEVLKTLTGKHEGTIDAETLRRLPDLVRDPVMVIKQENGRFGVVVNDAAGKDVLVVIDPAAEIDRKQASVVVTTHVKDAPAAILKAIGDGRVVYRDEGRSAEWLRKAQRQLPGTAAIQSFAEKIPTKADLVNKLGETYWQGPQGKIRLTEDGRSVITLMKSANASTYIHEMGHDWLERMMRDAADAEAPDGMRADATAVRQYLGVADGDALSTKAHEKFARSFERYFMEGRAPTQALAGVFAKFKAWLTSIYQTVAKLRAPITPDIRDVFDRLMSTADERVTVVPEAAHEIGPGAERPKSPAALTDASSVIGERLDEIPALAEQKAGRGVATPFVKVPKEPQRLVSLLRRLGGVRDVSGDIRSMLGGPRFRPGLINNATGLHLDEAAIRAWEHGYLPEAGGDPTINHLLDAIGDDLKSAPARYSQWHDAELADFERAHEMNAEVDRLAAEHAIDPTGLTRDQFFAKVAESIDKAERDEVIRGLADHHTDEFNAAIETAREWAEQHGERWDSDEFHGLRDARTLEDLEREHSGTAAQTAATGPADAARSDIEGAHHDADGGPSRGDQGDGQAGAGRGGGGADASGRVREAGRRRSEPSSNPAQPFGPSDEGLIDKAGNIRLDNLNVPDDVAQVIRDTAEQNADFSDARRGVVSDAQVIDLADALGMTPGELGKRKIGQAFNAEQVMAARKLLVRSATAVREAMGKAARGTDADVLAYGEARARHLMIQEQVSGITAEAGRALRAFRMLGAEGAEVASINEFLQGATGKTLFQMRREAQAGLMLDTPAQVSKFVADTAKPTFGDMALEYWINGLISGPQTHTTYAIGNALLALWKAGPETAAAAGIGAVRRLFGDAGERVYGGEVGAGLYAILKGQRDGIRAAYEAGRTGLTTQLPGENTGMTGASFTALQAQPQGAIPGKLGQVMRLPSRGVAVIHSYFRAIGYEQNLAALAYRSAAEERLAGDAFANRLAELTTNPPEEMMRQARNAATQQTLMGSGGEFTRKFAELTNTPLMGFRLLKVVDPFVKIGSNVLKQSLLERSPLGLLDPEIRANLMGRHGAVERDAQIARIAVGSALGATAVGLAAQDMMTGGGPSDPREAAVWRLTGRQPYSLRIGDTWYEMHRLGPLAMVMGVAADMHEFAENVEKRDLSHLAAMVTTALTKGILHESFMRGPSDLIRALEDPDRYGARYVLTQLTTLLPFATAEAQIARAMDPYARQARTTMDALKAHVPGLSQTLLPRRDVWGEPLPNHHDVGMDGLTSIAMSHVNNDPVNQALLRLRIYPAAPGRKITGVELTDQQYDDFSRVAGRMTKMRLSALVGQPGFDALPIGVQTKAITDTVTHARHAASELIKLQNPDIILQAMKARRDMLEHGKPER